MKQIFTLSNMAIAISLMTIPSPAFADERAPVIAPQAAAPIDTQSEHYQAAYRLAVLQNGGESLSDTVKKSIYSGISEVFTTDPDFQSLETEYPGITQALIAAIVPIAIKQTEDTMPALFDRLAQMYAAELTPADIAQANEYMATPAFQKLVDNVASNMDMTGLLNNVIKEDEVSEKALETAFESGVAKTVPDMGAKDIKLLMQFMGTEAYTKITALRPRRLAIETKWSNESSAAEDADMDAALSDVFMKFTGEGL